MKAWKAVIFDLSEVYLQGLLGTAELISNHLGSTVDDTHLFSSVLTQLFVDGASEDDYWAGLINAHRWDTSVADLRRLVRENFREIDGTRTIIEELKARGYLLGLLSIHARAWIDYCEEQFDYHRLFHAVVYSFHSKNVKPDRAAYEEILTLLNVQPEEAIFIDDSQRNVAAAEALGLKGILFMEPQLLRAELVALGVLLPDRGASE